jgi:glycerol uptake facilitator-like aquaporin
MPENTSKFYLSEAVNTSSNISRMLVAEALGAGVVTFCIVAAGILAERFSGGNIALSMLATSLAGVSAFVALRLVLFRVAPFAFTPLIALAGVLDARTPFKDALLVSAAQIVAAALGVVLAHLVTNTGLVQVATQIHTGYGIWGGEFVAGAFFVLVMRDLRNSAPWKAALAGGLTLLAVSLIMPSMSFANPAITLARALTDSFTAIRLIDAGSIAACQVVGAAAGVFLGRWLFAGESGERDTLSDPLNKQRE